MRFAILGTLLAACAQTHEPLDSAIEDASTGANAEGSGTGVLADYGVTTATVYSETAEGDRAIMLTSAAFACPEGPGPLRIEPDHWYLALFMEIFPAGEIPEGRYLVGTPNEIDGYRISMNAFIERTNDVCEDTLGLSFSVVATGSLEVLEYSEWGVRGTYDVYFGEDRIVGRFDAPRCVTLSDIDRGCI